MSVRCLEFALSGEGLWCGGGGGVIPALVRCVHGPFGPRPSAVSRVVAPIWSASLAGDQALAVPGVVENSRVLWLGDIEHHDADRAALFVTH